MSNDDKSREVSKLLFIKEPCRVPRVHDECDCPSEGGSHYIMDYPLIYTPLYWPGLFHDLFSDETKICRWLEKEFECVLRGGWWVFVNSDKFIVSSRRGRCKPFEIAFDDVASQSFSPRRVICAEVEKLDRELSIEKSNPRWMSSSKEHIILSLYGLEVEVIRKKCVSLDLKVDVNSKRSMCEVVYDRIQSMANELRGLETNVLKSMWMSAGEVGSEVPMLRSQVMCVVFARIFGDDIMERYRIPEANEVTGSDALFDNITGFMFSEVSRTKHSECLRGLGRDKLFSSASRIHPLRGGMSSLTNMEKMSKDLVTAVRARCEVYDRTRDFDIVADLESWDPFCLMGSINRRCMVRRLLRMEFGEDVEDVCFNLKNVNDLRKINEGVAKKNRKNLKYELAEEEYEERCRNWPEVVQGDVVLDRLRAYKEAMKWEQPPVCAVCSRNSIEQTYSVLKRNSKAFTALRLKAIKCVDPLVEKALRVSGDYLQEEWGELSGMVLDKRGLSMDEKYPKESTICVCNECEASLKNEKMPRYALANNLYRGKLPLDLRDLTWVEEMVCCVYRTSAFVTRLYRTSDDGDPFMLHGNTCAHDTHLVSTAKVLPCTPSDMNDMLSVVFIGPGTLKHDEIKKLFYVRREKILKFLVWLKDNNEMYSNIPISHEVLNMYPADDALPGVRDRVITTDVPSEEATVMFKKETAGFHEHPFELPAKPTEGGKNISNLGKDEEGWQPMIEKSGMIDPEGSGVSGRDMVVSGLNNLMSRGGAGVDLKLYRSGYAMRDYHNPALFPGMYPTLYPFGIGGFQVDSRTRVLSIQSQASYYFDIVDRDFRYHYSYMFVILNIIQRHAGHLQTYFTVRKSRFEAVANEFGKMSPSKIKQIAKKIQEEGLKADAGGEQKLVQDLMGEVKTISARVLGSSASKAFLRHEIRSYMGLMGMPQIFLTINPNPHHSPVFQVMYGDLTVDLDSRFPDLVGGAERARRLAKDPVAAADFFDHSVRCIFVHLFGWNEEEKCSSTAGGILGHLKAYYGTAEYTNRGCLHGHFLLWLEGGMNPSDVHDKMRRDEEFKLRYFRYFEDILKHDIPVPDGQNLDVSHYEPRTEMPPGVPDLSDCTDDVHLELMDDWESVMRTEIYMCGESLQRHVCLDVCHKYGNEGRCRFLFPHEIIDASKFDEETNSVLLLCRDANVNWYNPYILVFCRHNHDIRCILSGKSAKAAMFYITDYITKMDVKTNQMLSLFCKAVVKMEFDAEDSPLASVKRMLHKCLSHYGSQQSIHAQQAVRYVRGNGDSMSSHDTVPMLSGMVVRYIKLLINPLSVDNEVPDPRNRGHLDGESSQISVAGSGPRNLEEDGTNVAREDNADNEIKYVRLQLSEVDGGDMRYVSQLADYLYRDRLLNDVCFFDFACRYRICKKSSACGYESRMETYTLLEGHPCSRTHEMVERYEGASVRRHRLPCVPRVVGSTIPRVTNLETYAIFAIGHFMPFSVDNIAISEGEDPIEKYRGYKFGHLSREIMSNWEAIHECEDARDAENLKRDERHSDGMENLKEVFTYLNDHEGDDISALNIELRKATEKDFRALKIVGKLRDANYISSLNPAIDTHTLLKVCATDSAKDGKVKFGGGRPFEKWIKEAKAQDRQIGQDRRRATDPRNQSMETKRSSVRRTGTKRKQDIGSSSDSDDGRTSIKKKRPNFKYPVKQTVGKLSEGSKNVVARGRQDVLNDISEKYTLNEKQRFAFAIAAEAFFSVLDRRISKERGNMATSVSEPLRMLMTGPGGTGKTHVVKALKELMSEYDSGYRLRLLAPTGSAAALIGGSTCHAGLFLSVRKKREQSKGKGRSSVNDKYTEGITVQGRMTLRSAWKDVDILLIDEMSMVSGQLLNDIDNALRYAKEKPDEWFGGIIMLFSGDMFQFPPVVGTALYSVIRGVKNDNDWELRYRLGRLAWKTINEVVDFTEQHRMKDDPSYAEAVYRLRMRMTTKEDVDLFNSRVMLSADNPDGVDMGSRENKDAVMIVGTNRVREFVNTCKATCMSTVRGEDGLVVSTAIDSVNGSALSSSDNGSLKKSLLAADVSQYSSDGALLGYLPLFIGMPVILRNKNPAVELGIANGSQGFVREIDMVKDGEYTTASVVIVEFPGSKVDVGGLQAGYYPVKAENWSFNTVVETVSAGGVVRERISVSRKQIPIQPGYAVTGQSAQGKTMPKVMVDLKDTQNNNGFASYVAVSRARNLNDLCLMQSISLSDLDVDLPPDLINEHRRFLVMEHNTFVRHGFKVGEVLPVPDPEDRNSISVKRRESAKTGRGVRASKGRESVDMKRNINAVEDNGSAPSAAKKRKMSLQDAEAPDGKIDEIIGEGISNMDVRFEENCDDEVDSRPSTHCRTLSYPGCRWSSTNWSCAYDSVFMAIWSIYRLVGEDWKSEWKDWSMGSCMLGGLFDDMSASTRGSPSSDDIDVFRDRYRDLMYDTNRTSFPRYGRVMASAGDLMHRMWTRGHGRTNVSFVIEPVEGVRGTEEEFPQLVLSSSDGGGIVHDLQCFVCSVLKGHEMSDDHGPHCHETVGCRGRIQQEPIWMTFEINTPGSAIIHPSEVLSIPSKDRVLEFRLRSIVYFGEAHYTCRFVDGDDVYCYDGQVRGGECYVEDANTLPKSASYGEHRGKLANLCVYVRE